MPVSERFLALVGFQLGQFIDCPEVRSLVVYVTQQGETGQPTLLPVGHWPPDERALPPVDTVSRLRVPAEQRRWLPLRDGQRLLGALQVEASRNPWPEPLAQRLQAVTLALTEALRLDLEGGELRQRLTEREEQLGLLLHQLRNPLTALRTFGQLLLRRLGPEHRDSSLVQGLLAEERQINRYVDAISELVHPEGLLVGTASPQPLLLPPLLSGPEGQPLAGLLEPLLQRAAATATLQGRDWHGPEALPDWSGDSGAVAEILANLLENAFRYSPHGASVGLHTASDGQLLQLTVWDGGPAIATEERQAIFGRGVRGTRGQDLPGTGLGLALGRDLARSLGGELELVVPPRAVAETLPEQGNAFQLSLPRPPAAAPRR
ncbi:HAMP domain-containing histidine kinase [Cyanobium sp. AMD-g]|uniref:sensor histidine kinase n=1 Tax=Cyanobium sp. AMD-g TaxID=2823699 RepID=UPI0020CD6348|nr:HAMP domain-containing sensor histidine kinase [Cyanobium sp. AMD-g]MCP9931065.1 HAMP domain-containing histidine kinase [Cyanobium sp. AMD-g]